MTVQLHELAMPCASILPSKYTPCMKCAEKMKVRNRADTSSIMFLTCNQTEVSTAMDFNHAVHKVHT